MTCKAGMIATVVSSTPKLVEAWQKVKNFGVGSTVEVFKVEGHEAVVIFRSGNRQDKVKVPVMCLSCYSGKDVPSGAVWDGTNKDLRPLPEEDGEDLAVPAAGISAEVAEAEMSGRRICPTCGAAVSEVDSMCNVCGGMMPPPADRFALGELEADGQEGSISCPSCGAIVEPDAKECPICETPFEVVEKIQAENMKAGVAVQAPAPKKAKAAEPREAPEPRGKPEPKRETVNEPEPSEPGRVCPSCGAAVGPDAKECPVCETPFGAVREAETEPEAEPEPEKPKVAAAVTVPVKEKSKSRWWRKEATPKPEPEPEPAEPGKQETICPSCGAVLDEGAEECFICGAKVGEAPAEAPVAEPEVPPEMPAEEFARESPPEKEPEMPEEEFPEMPPETPPEEPAPKGRMAAEEPAPEMVCAGCGAVLDEGAEECFICGAKVGEAPAEIPKPATKPAEEPAPEPEPLPAEVPEKPAEEVVLGENEIQCPSCFSVIPADSEKCPECWTDLSLYVRCPACGKYTPAGEETCRECFATVSVAPEIGPAEAEAALGLDEVPVSFQEVEITEELRVEMTSLETEEEQGKECLVCGAIFGPDDQLCPICGIEYGQTVEEPPLPEGIWDHMDVGVPPTVHICPSCGTNVTGLEATEREVNEGKWFYRGLVAIFIGIFFTSFSIYARGVSMENESLGMQVPPTDVVLNLFGWILVVIGFVFWFMSWRLHGQRQECPHCGIETDPQMAVCINCKTQLIDREEEGEDEPEQEVKDQYNLLTEKPLQYDMPSGELPPEEAPPEEMPAEEMPPEQPAAEEPVTEEPEIPPEIPEEPKAPEAKPAHFEHGEDIPLDQEEHRKCPGCGIFIDAKDTVCPICDTPIGPQEGPEPVLPAPEPERIPDRDIQVPSEEEELEGMGLTDEPKADIDNITVPDGEGGQIECPSCGASLEPGTKSCPVCEYPITE